MKPRTGAAELAGLVQKTPRIGIDQASITAPAWRTIPTHYLVADRDLALDPATQVDLAERMGAAVTHADAPHAVMLTHPAEVAGFLARIADGVVSSGA
jgi:pimeloyl-ACP methyl ester carboxylesterase